MAELQTMVELTQKVQTLRAMRRLDDKTTGERLNLLSQQSEMEKLLAQSAERWLISQGLVE